MNDPVIRKRQFTNELGTSKIPSRPMAPILSTITHEPLDSIKLWKENARNNDAAVPKLGRILIRHGQITPIVVWTKNRVIYKGNTTWKALDWWRNLPEVTYRKILEDMKLPVDRPRPTTALVLWAEFKDEKTAVDYGVADNKASEWSMWDEDKLESLITKYYKDIDTMEKSGGITALGFTSEELKNLTMIPDLDKVKKSSAVVDLSGILKLKCPAEVRDELRDWLLENLKDYGFENVEII